MRALRLTHSDELQDIFEWEEPPPWPGAFGRMARPLPQAGLDAIEVVETDITCDVAVEEAPPTVQLRYGGANAFLGVYLSRLRYGEGLVIALDRGVRPGAVLDVEIAVAGYGTIVLNAQVLGRWPLESSDLAEVQFVTGRLTDRIVAPIAERALGPRHAVKLLS